MCFVGRAGIPLRVQHSIAGIVVRVYLCFSLRSGGLLTIDCACEYAYNLA